jgi:hypothetical protein
MEVLIGFIVLCTILLAIISPRTFFKISEGWKYEDVEPSEAYIHWIRAGAIIALIALPIFWYRLSN